MKDYGIGRIRGRRPRLGRALAFLFAGIGPAVGLLSCGSETAPDAGLDRSERYVQREKDQAPPSERERPAAILAGEPISWAELRPALAEAAGGRVLEEVALDRLLAAQAAAAGIVIGPAQIDAEQRLLAQSLGLDGSDPVGDAEVIDRVRRLRGLGEVRYAALLRRNATLRALAAPTIVVDEDAARRAYELRYGELIEVRLLTTATLREAQGALDRLRAGEPFGEVAAQVSTDVSAARGGILEPIHPSDASYPAALRQALIDATDGQVAGPIALEQGYALALRVGSTLPRPAPLFESVRDAMEREARLNQERLLMDRLARRMLEGIGLTALDRSLDWSWRAWRNP